MRYSYPNAKVLFIADMAIHDDSRYEYKWDINYTEKDIETVYGYKIYYSFKELGVKDIKLTVTDKVLGLTSVYNNKIYITQKNWLNAGKLASSDMDVSLFVWTLVRSGLYGEGIQDFINQSINIDTFIEGLAIFGHSEIEASMFANKSVACYLYSNRPGVTINGYTEITFDEFGELIMLSDTTDVDGYNITIRLDVDYEFDYVDLFVDIYEIVDGNEIETLNGLNILIGQLFVNNPISAEVRTDPSTGLNFSFNQFYSWEGKASSTFLITAASNFWFVDTHPLGIITKDSSSETTNVFDILNVEQDLVDVITYSGNYYYTHELISTNIPNSSVPPGISLVNYTLTCHKGNFPETSTSLTVGQLSRNLVATPFSEDITFIDTNDVKVFQITKEVGKQIRVYASGLNSHTAWWDYMLNLIPIRENGLAHNGLNDQYFANGITFDFSDEANNTNEVALVLRSSSYHPSFTFHLDITQL